MFGQSCNVVEFMRLVPSAATCTTQVLNSRLHPFCESKFLVFTIEVHLNLLHMCAFTDVKRS